MDLTKQTRRTLLIGVALSAVTLAVYWPQTGHDFISYDDSYYLTENAHVRQGLTWANVAWAFRTGEAGNWHPVTWLSHLVDVQLFGLRPGGHHLMSLLFHAANAALLFLLLQRMTGAPWRSAFVAALFALHPLHVQSVAWAAERKDVLSGFFFMLTLLAYAGYAEAQRRGMGGMGDRGLNEPDTHHAPRTTHHAPRTTHHAPRFYALSLLCFALGLMSKPMLVTVPFVLLLLDYWPLRRLELKTQDSRLKTLLPLVREKLPFFALSGASCLLTLWAQKAGGAVVPVTVLPLSQRLANAVVAYTDYLGKAFWPAHLAVLYPFGGGLPTVAVILSGAVLAGITVWTVVLPLLLWRRGQGRGGPYLAVGWLWFLGMLVPVIGLVQVGMQRMADRYTYLPLIGVFIMVAWEVPEQLNRWRLSPRALAAAAGLVLAACAAATNWELSYWQDSEHLFGHALEIAPANYIALDNYGRALLKEHKLAEAARSFSAAVALRPDLDAARCGLGTTLLEQGKYNAAADQFNRVLALQPDHVAARLQLGIVLGRQGKLAEAAEAFRRVLRVRPEDAGAHNNLGNVLALQGKPEEAAREFEATLRLQPDHAGALNNLAISCRKLGRISEAIGHYREAIRLQPESVEAINNLAWLLAAHPDGRFRNGAEAVQLATRACELTKYQNPVALTTLAAAYAETGQFQTAVSFVEQAQDLAKGGQGSLAERLAAMLGAFRARQPYHQL